MAKSIGCRMTGALARIGKDETLDLAAILPVQVDVMGVTMRLRLLGQDGEDQALVCRRWLIGLGRSG
ncbi:hypothetical protein GCM10025772_08000 [Ferrimonas gelatinilytica]|uniref:Uncharacterized protein n=1 Tax=Ferrimonas gelatinilytica TaxID=1255257 RepID=A0ABP9RXF1_9GAMM